MLRAAVRADVTGFFPNPPASNESYTFEMNRWVVGALVGLDRGLNVVPALAEHWLTPDDRTFVLELRPGLRFSDGRPASARDAAESLLAGIRLRWPNLGYLSTIESVRVIGEHRIEVRAARPDPTLLARLAWGFVLPADELGKSPVPVVGAAPYTLERWTPGAGFSFARNPNYWGEPAAFQRAEFRVVPDDAARLALVENGEADLADFVPPEDWERLPGTRAAPRGGRGHRVLFLGLRVDRSPFSDPRIREAFDLAIDRRAIVEKVLAGKGSVANQLLPRGAVGHLPELPPSRYDPERARALLRAAGIRPGHKLRLDGPYNRYVRDVEIMHEVARQLALVGVEVEVNALEKSALYALLAAGARTSTCSAGRASRATGPTPSRCCFPRPARRARAPTRPPPRRTRAASTTRSSLRSRARRSRARTCRRARRCCGARSRASPSCGRSCRSWCSPRPSSTTPDGCAGTRR